MGLKDVAYAILRYSHRTAARERALVERYHAGLVMHGVVDYPWDACWRHYRRLAAEQPLFPLRCWAGNWARFFWGPVFIRRALAAFRDLDCAELLAAQERRQIGSTGGKDPENG
jgi:hypothetical protein